MPPFQGSDVPLEEDVLKKPIRQFFPTFAEWVSDNNAEQINISAQQTGAGSTTVLTIAQNFTFFLTTAASFAMDTNNVASVRTGAISIGGVANSTLILAGVHAAGDNFFGSVSYPMPIRVEAGQSIIVTSSANMNHRASITGFLLPKKISIR